MYLLKILHHFRTHVHADHPSFPKAYGNTVYREGSTSGTSGTNSSDGKLSGCGSAAGAGAVNPPVLYNWVNGLIMPALPIWQTEELEMPSIFKL
jgi:hypothetical protein